MDVIKVWVPLREYLSVQALYDAANALYWKISERRNSTHLAFFKHQNTKTSLCELSKNHWVIAPFYISGPIKRKLQSIYSLFGSPCSLSFYAFYWGQEFLYMIVLSSFVFKELSPLEGLFFYSSKLQPAQLL